MLGVGSLGALAVGARSTARYAYSRTIAAAPAMLGGKCMLALGVVTLVAFATFRPLLRFLDRHLFASGPLFSHSLPRVKGQRASNKGARIQHNTREKYYTSSVRPCNLRPCNLRPRRC